MFPQIQQYIFRKLWEQMPGYKNEYCPGQNRTLVLTGIWWVSRQFPTTEKNETER